MLVGVVATLSMDGVIWLRKWIWGVTALDYRLVGRWIGHLAAGHFSREPITAKAPVRGEEVIGWVVHYAVGVAFAAGLVAVSGWEPSLGPCGLTGLVTRAAPFLVLQPAMCAGV